MASKADRQLYIISDIPSLSDKDFTKLLRYIEEDKARRLWGMKREKAQASLVGRLLAKYAIHQKWGLPFCEIQFGTTLRGKPYVIGYEHIYFSISHSGVVCACAVADTPIGIDIQKMDVRNFQGIVRRFFTEEEQEVFFREGGDRTAFYRMWTRRESIGKYLGSGFYYKKEEDIADWQVEHSIYQNEYMVCICMRAR